MKKKQILMLLLVIILISVLIFGTGQLFFPYSDITNRADQSKFVPSQTFSFLLPGNTSSNNSNIGQNVVITFAVDGGEKGFYEQIAESFHRENPSNTVQIVTPPGGFDLWNAEDLSPLAEAADTALFIGGRERLLNNASDFLDLSPLMEGDTGFEPDDFWPGSLAACQDSQGRTLGLPLALTFMGLFYDADALQAAGITLPAVGWTLDDFRTMVQALAALKSGPIIVDANAWQSSVLAPGIDASIAAAGGQIQTTQLAQLAQWYVDWVRQGKLVPFSATGSGDGSPDPHPIFWVGALNANQPDGSDQPALESYQITHFPINTENGKEAGSSPVWPNCALISAGTKHPQTAWAWIDYLSRQSLNVNLPSGDIPPAIPARQSVSEARYPWNDLPQDAQATVRYGLANAWYGSVDPQVFDTVGNAIAASLTGSVSLQETLAQAVIPPSPTPRTSPIVVAGSAPQETAPTGNQVVRYLYPNFPNSDQVYQALATEFQKTHPDVTLQLSSDFTWRGGDPLPSLTQDYDCFYFSGLSNIADIRSMADLSPFLTQEDSSFQSDFYPGRLDALTVDGHVYGLPADNDAYLVKINLDLLDQLGLALPSVDWTADDLIRFIQQAAPGPAGISFYASAGLEDYLLAAQSVQWIDFTKDPPSITIDTSANVQAVDWLATQARNRAVFPLDQINTTGMSHAISAGQVLLWTSLSSNPIEYPFRTANLPMPQASFSSTSRGWVMQSAQFISDQSNVKQVCWDWMRFLSDQPDAFRNMPARQSVVQSPVYATQVGAATVRVYDVTQANSGYSQVYLNTLPVSNWTWQAVVRVFQGEDTQGVLAEVQRKTEQYTQCLAEINLLASKIATVSIENAPERAVIGQCARKADPEYQDPAFP